MNKSLLRGFPLLTIILTLGLSMPFASPASAKGNGFKIPPHALEIAPGLFYLGIAEDVDYKPVQGFAIVHPKRGYGHKPGHGGGNGGGKKGGGGGSTCFAFLANGARWKVTENYVMDPINIDGLSDNSVTSDIVTALTAWDNEVGFNIFGSGVIGDVDGADEVQPDGVNEFLFDDIDSPGSIGVTIVWGIFFGPPRNRELVEWEMVLDDVDFDFGNADVDSGVMDFLNIVTHEVGHAAGMGHPSDDCTEETMFRFADIDETKKRDLNAGDKAGIKKLYK